MEGKHIQLPYGVLYDKEPKHLLHFNLFLNYKRDILFEQFPYLSHVKNPTLNKIIKMVLLTMLSFIPFGNWFVARYYSAKFGYGSN